ncbi:hypothetical protein HBH98_069080 [Parastagonospora nodorum]|nr:hypothetical protein HBH52_066490 [Parastagonospora nodorum]KAH4182781.1 hypothetical protein HBH42_213750 [Parastagonospora nodorum]KAH4264592.1 hypothetical protein HBI03_093490 [Parastagonospora nodorum]KAH4278357.1 hypothetical protein HBI04_078880 [Parastagonospora nodorum]KAH4349548.1 hypothetical protein HBH98_069080 [Parastagonospora nodorum]
MRLINTKTGALEEFLGEDIPEYAILSHTWGEGEVTYQDYQKGLHKTKKGYRKIQKTCDIAAEAKIGYTWVDTCCIDKKSSAELSEAINSMYRWYAQSKICYAFLSDLSGDADITTDLKSCRWFTRGWTLQELIAPETVLFFDARWNKRGYKTSIAAELSTITKIDAALLRNQSSPSDFCIAQRLSWAAKRKTSRLEDAAYCLLGLFDLNMPLLYGEGEKAFRRLQLEIIRSTPDLSIFAWTLPIDTVNSSEDPVLCGILAKSPACFEGCYKYSCSEQAGYSESSVTNLGIKIRAHIFGRRLNSTGALRYVLPLNCTVDGRPIHVRLRQVGYDKYVRVDPSRLFQYDEGALQTTRPAEHHLLLTVGKKEMSSESKFLPFKRRHVIKVAAQPTALPWSPWPADRYDMEDQLFFITGDSAQDFSMIDITFLIQSPLITTSEYKWVRCKFIAVGWSAGSLSNAQFGVVEEDKYAAKIRALQPQITDWSRNSELLAYYLNRYKVPKAKAVRFPLSHLGYVAHVTFAAIPDDSPSICQSNMWTISFSCVLWPMNNEPYPDEEQWNTTGAQ